MAFNHLPVYRRWKDLPPTGGPKPEKYQTANNLKMEDHGFPTRIAKAFLQTADKLNAVVLTRVPGKVLRGFVRSWK